MNTGETKIRYLTRAKVELADNEKVSLWENSRAGSLRIDGTTLYLKGKWKVSAIGNFLGGGILGEILIKPFFLKERSETLSGDTIERIIIYTKKNKPVIHVFQPRAEGKTEVHVFRPDKETAPQIVNTLKTNMPHDKLKEETA